MSDHKLALVCSRGGHLLQLYLLKPWWERYERFWITGAGGDVNGLLRRERVFRGFFPVTRNWANAVRNFFLCFRLFFIERPQLVVSTGAGIAPPALLAAKLLGIKTIFIDSISFERTPSLSARLVQLYVDKLLVQHEKTVKTLAKAEFWGQVL